MYNRQAKESPAIPQDNNLLTTQGAYTAILCNIRSARYLIPQLRLANVTSATMCIRFLYKL